uniref:Uncharacterized protein n=1 Tax=Rhizophagus irregularis (strain DAOM 181602 / DAOM 197198 / MUCL 43194) TaxID=747089 RepID=U9TV31_RHIID
MFELNQDVIYLIFKELEDVTNLFIHVFLLAEHAWEQESHQHFIDLLQIYKSKGIVKEYIRKF